MRPRSYLQGGWAGQWDTNWSPHSPIAPLPPLLVRLQCPGSPLMCPEILTCMGILTCSLGHPPNPRNRPPSRQDVRQAFLIQLALCSIPPSPLLNMYRMLPIGTQSQTGEALGLKGVTQPGGGHNHVFISHSPLRMEPGVVAIWAGVLSWSWPGCSLVGASRRQERCLVSLYFPGPSTAPVGRGVEGD